MSWAARRWLFMICDRRLIEWSCLSVRLWSVCPFLEALLIWTISPQLNQDSHTHSYYIFIGFFLLITPKSDDCLAYADAEVIFTVTSSSIRHTFMRLSPLLTFQCHNSRNCAQITTHTSGGFHNFTHQFYTALTLMNMFIALYTAGKC